jgi:Transposase DDE domain group 1
VCSLLFAGKQLSLSCLKPLVWELERVLDLNPQQRSQIVLRFDAGFGTDANFNWVLWRGYQVVGKSYHGKRAGKLAGLVTEWTAIGAARWVAACPQPLRYGRRTQQAMLQWKTSKGKVRHAHVITSQMEWSLAELVEAYDDRAQMEKEIRSDKSGLLLAKRRKRRLPAQEALVLLTDLAHNIAVWSKHWIFTDPSFADYGVLRVVQDLLAIPGKITFREGQMVELKLNTLHPLAKPVLAGLARLFT